MDELLDDVDSPYLREDWNKIILARRAKMPSFFLCFYFSYHKDNQKILDHQIFKELFSRKKK
jgi:hypothetical protein